MSTNLSELTIQKTIKHLKKGDFSVSELVESFLNTAREKNKDINAYLEIYEDALGAAKESDERIKGGKLGALEGIPIAVKDNILVKGQKASAASKILEGYTATYDATVIKKLKDSGAIFVGRTNMDEFAMGSSTEYSAYGETKNPHDTKRVPGGSSGGSAAAVAMGGAMAALGSDTAGSVRQPAALCGIVGLKPTYGSVSRSGLIALGSSFDVIGPMAKTVADAELVFNVIKGRDPMDSTTVDESFYKKKKVRRPVIGLPKFVIESGGLEDDVKDNFERKIKGLLEKGYEIKEIEMPHIEMSVPAYYVILPAEASANLARFDGVRYGKRVSGENLWQEYMNTRGEGFGKEVRRRVVLGTYVLSAGYYDAYYGKAQEVREMITRDFLEAFEEVDLIVTPTSPEPAFKFGEKTLDPVKMYLEDVFTVPANHAGIPAISVPSGTVLREGKSLPVGIQFMAPHMREDLLFKIGKEVELV